MALETILPEDLLDEILLRVPLKSLVQCKCLSTYWKARISRRCLTRTRLERYPEPNSTLIALFEGSLCSIHPCNNGDIYSTGVEFWYSPGNYPNCRVVGSQHGLICFSNYITGDALVWNPLMGRVRMLNFQRLSYSPFNTFSGFGYDTIKDDYKVVRIIYTQLEAKRVIIEIFELRNREPRVIVMPSIQVPFVLCKTAPVTVNGSSHWIAFHPKNKNLQIVLFDMDREKFVEIPFSGEMANINYDVDIRRIEDLNLGSLKGFDMDGKRFRLGVFKGSLCLFLSNSLKVEIWSMKRHDSHVVWTRMFEIPICRGIQEVVGFTANDEFVICCDDNVYFAYDPWRERFVFALGHFFNAETLQTVAFAESLVPVSPE